ncbi:MAG: UbiA family prenyltransferase [Candidatus Bathyarchaeota archaeon]|nr:MAG: UbiA family prenyltransferase [Candidatus Bathyarchaeota archaeon]
MLNRLKGLIALVRVRHTGQVIGIVSILSLKRTGFSFQSLVPIASFLFLSIALFAFDDAHDYKSDVQNHPNRPIPKGVLTSNQVYIIGISALGAGLVAAMSLALHQLLLFLLVAFLGFLVIFLKLSSLIRAALIGLMMFLLFPFGISIGVKSTLFGLIVALPHIAGTIAKDFIHSKGDENIGLQPPSPWTKHLASFLFFISGGIILFPIMLSLVTWWYTLLIIPTLTSCLFLGFKVIRSQYDKVYIYGGVGMVSVLLAFATSI